jgi:hypothetical protein
MKNDKKKLKKAIKQIKKLPDSWFGNETAKNKDLSKIKKDK